MYVFVVVYSLGLMLQQKTLFKQSVWFHLPIISLVSHGHWGWDPWRSEAYPSCNPCICAVDCAKFYLVLFVIQGPNSQTLS